MKDAVLFVTSSGQGVGKGHEKRCTQLQTRCSLFGRRYLADGNTLSGPDERVLEVFDWKERASFVETVRRLHATVLFFDTPELTDLYLSTLREVLSGCYFVSYENYFNDLGVFDLNVDMGYDRSPERRRHGVEGSLRYSIFDPGVYAFRRASFTVPEKPEVLVSFGGTDINDCSTTALSMLLRVFGEHCTIHLVIGPYFAHRDTLRSRADGLHNLKVYDSPDSVYPLMERCDIGIVNSGTTYLESIVVRLPCFPVPQNGYEHTLRRHLSEQFGFPYVEGFTEQVIQDWLRAGTDCARATQAASSYFRSFDGVQNLEGLIVERFKTWGVNRYDTSPDPICRT